MIGMAEGANNSELYEVRDLEKNETLALYSSDDTHWCPLMFTPDGTQIVFVRGDGQDTVTTVQDIGTMPPRHEMEYEGTGAMVDVPNDDWSLWAGMHGQVVSNTGKTALITDATREPLFDMYGNVWYQVAGGKWKRVDKQCNVQTLPKPGYLVQFPFTRRGSMRLDATEQTMEHEYAQAKVGAVWLHHDRAKGGLDGNRPRNLSALVHAGADVFWCAFVPGRDVVMVGDALGTTFVPFKVENP